MMDRVSAMSFVARSSRAKRNAAWKWLQRRRIGSIINASEIWCTLASPMFQKNVEVQLVH